MSEISPSSEAHRSFSVVQPSYRDTDPEVFARIARRLTFPPPCGLKKPLPEDRDLLRALLDEAERCIRSAEDWISGRHRLACGVYHGLIAEEIRADHVRLEQILPQVPILAMEYAPWTKGELLFFMAYMLRTGGPCSEHPSVEEILADEGLAAMIGWFLALAHLVHKEVFFKLAAHRGPGCPSAPSSQNGSGALIASEVVRQPAAANQHSPRIRHEAGDASTLLVATLETLIARGQWGTTNESIIEQAGISKDSFYRLKKADDAVRLRLEWYRQQSSGRGPLREREI